MRRLDRDSALLGPGRRTEQANLPDVWFLPKVGGDGRADDEDEFLAESLCLDHGVTEPLLLQQGERELRHLKKGWELPVYARMDVPAFELSIAKAYLALGARENAVPHLSAVAEGKGPVADEAKRLLKPKAVP